MAVLNDVSGRTVRDLRNLLFARIGSNDPKTFTARSADHYRFWSELHQIPRRRGHSPLTVENIDAVAQLTPQEWQGMTRRLAELIPAA